MSKMKEKFVYKYWFKGMRRPKKLLKDCEVYYEIRTPVWQPETADPGVWETIPRRWKSARRPSKHERLLKALLKGADIMVEDGGQSFVNFKLSLKIAHELSAIKERMQKKARK